MQNFTIYGARISTNTEQEFTISSSPVSKWLIIGAMIFIGSFGLLMATGFGSLERITLGLKMSLIGILPCIIIAIGLPIRRQIRFDLITQQVYFESKYIINLLKSRSSIVLSADQLQVSKRNRPNHHNEIYLQSEKIKHVEIYPPLNSKVASDEIRSKISHIVDHLDSGPINLAKRRVLNPQDVYTVEQIEPTIEVLPEPEPSDQSLFEQLSQPFKNWTIWVIFYALLTAMMGFSTGVYGSILFAIGMLIILFVGRWLKHPAFLIPIGIIFLWLGLFRFLSAISFPEASSGVRSGLIQIGMGIAAINSWRNNRSRWNYLKDEAQDLDVDHSFFERPQVVIFWGGVGLSTLGFSLFILANITAFLLEIQHAPIVQLINGGVNQAFISFAVFGFGLSLASILEKLKPKWLIYCSISIASLILVLKIIDTIYQIQQMN